MLKYHVAVCDDEKSDLDGIVQSVQQYDVQGCFDIETYMDGNELLSELQMQKKSFDLLLLDIEMPSNGFQLAQSLIQMEKHPLVVFVTKRHEYAVQGYGIAFRYLVKPLDQTLFAAAMDAVLQELNSKHFTIEYDGVTMSLETSDIYFLESHGHKVLIHCKEQDLTLRMSIPEALEQLPKRCFVSPHKSYLRQHGTHCLRYWNRCFSFQRTSAADQQEEASGVQSDLQRLFGKMMLYYFVEFAGSFANIALLLLFIGRLFPKKEPVSRWFYAYVALLIAGQCALSLFPDWVTQRTIYLLVGGFFLALLFYEVRPWQAVSASGAFFTLIALVEVLAMLLIGLRIPDTDILMQAGAARLVYVVFSNLIQIPLVVLISHFFSRKGNALRILWLLPIIAIQVASIAVCYVAQYHAADEYFPDYMVGLMAVLLLINILIVFYVEALRENELEKFKVKFNEQQYNLQMEYYQQLKERQEEVRSLRHDVKKYILAMQAVAEHGDTEELHKIAQAATDIFERSTNVSAVGNPVVDALLNYYLRIAEKNNIKVKLDVTIPEVLTISSLSLSIIIGNTFDNAIEACCDLPAEQRIIHLQLRKQYRSLFYRLENPYSDTVRSIRIGEYHGYGLKNINRIVQENHGDFYTKKKDGVFTVQVRLNCEN